MTAPNTTPQIPSRDDHGTTSCPVCRRVFTPTGRQTYCGTACRKTAFRRRHQPPRPGGHRPGRQACREYTVYEYTVYEWPRLRRTTTGRATLRNLPHLHSPGRRRARSMPKLR